MFVLYATKKNSVIFTEFYVCVNTYFDTICVHQQKSATPCKIYIQFTSNEYIKTERQIDYLSFVNTKFILILYHD